MAVSKLQRLTISADDGESIDFETYVDDEGEVTFTIEGPDGWEFELTRDEVEVLGALIEVSLSEYEAEEWRALDRMLEEKIDEDDAA